MLENNKRSESKYKLSDTYESEPLRRPSWMIALNALLRAEHNRVIRFHHENSPHNTRLMTPRPGSVLSDADLCNEGDSALRWDMIHSSDQTGLTKIWQNHKKSSAHNASNVTDYFPRDTYT